MINIEELKHQQYDLSNIAQSIFLDSYLKPFPPKSSNIHHPKDPKHFEITDPKISRCTHGAMHASRVVAFVKIIHLFRQDKGDTIIHAIAELIRKYNLTLVQLINLLQITALFHDVAREDEGIDHWDEESAQVCAHFLKKQVKDLSDVIISLLSNTIFYKDNTQGFIDAAISLGLNPEEAIISDYLRQLVHDADCLDVMRVRKTFKMQFLDMVNADGLQHAIEDMKAFVKEVLALIHHQGDQYFNCVMKLHDEILANESSNFDAQIKHHYESSNNVYHEITQDMKKFPHLSRIERPLQEADEYAYYRFNTRLIEAIRQAFLSASMVSQPLESSFPDKKDYFFIPFSSPIMTPFFNEEKPLDRDVVALIYFGDAELTKYCNKTLKPLGAFAELGFSWVGSFDKKKYVEINGFSLKIIYPDHKMILRESILNLIFSEMEKTSFIANHTQYTHDLLSRLNPETAQEQASILNQSIFSVSKRSSIISPIQLDIIKEFIAENMTSISAHYVRSNEQTINPTYQSADQITQQLKIHQKKIWLLRSDFILAVGNKNSNWINFKDTELSDAIEKESHPYVNWEDRYGHPSLATPHLGYDGSAYYGGYLAQRNGYIEIYTFSGRYHRHDLEDKLKAVMEAYIAYQFQHAYGEQPIVFIDAVAFGPGVLDNFELSFFIKNHPLPDYCIRRIYDSEKIDTILCSVPSQELRIK